MRRFRKSVLVGLLAVLPFVLVGCDTARKVVGNQKDAPDEFAVYERPPLSLPPEFALRPPEPGSIRPQAITPADQARAALLRRQASITTDAPRDPNLSDGLNAMMQRTGAAEADPSIREVVNAETTLLSREDERLADKMIFWVESKPFGGTVVDAAEEQRRIRENLALGKPLTEGDVPEIRKKRGRKGLLDF